MAGSSFRAAGKPARPFAPSAEADTILPSGVVCGRGTMLSSSSLGDSVSQRGEAPASVISRGTDGPHSSIRTVSSGRDLVAFRQLSTAWRPPAGLPLSRSNGTTVSCYTSASGAGSVSCCSNYAETSAAALFYKQRQQQHSPCIFGDGRDYATSVGGRSVPTDEATGADVRMQQRGPYHEDDDAGSCWSRGAGRQHKTQGDSMRAAGVPTAVWHARQEQQQQRKLEEVLDAADQSAQQIHHHRNLSESTDPRLQQSSQVWADESSRLRVQELQQPSSACADQQARESQQLGGRDAALGQQGNSGAGAPSRTQGLTDTPSVDESLQAGSMGSKHPHENSELSNAMMQEDMQDCAREGPRQGLTRKSSGAPSADFQCSTTAFAHPTGGSTASSGDYSPSPASPSTPLQAEQEGELERHQELHQQLQEMHSAEEEDEEEEKEEAVFPRTTEPGDSPAANASAVAASSSPSTPRSSRSRWQPRAEEDSVYSATRGNRDTPTCRGSRGLAPSSFVPREDPRSSREKQIQALRSTGSVMPVSVVADAAVAAAAAAASYRSQGGGGGGRGAADAGAGDTGVGAARDPPGAHAAAYPLNLMGKSSEQERDAGRRATARTASSRLLPLDIAWHSSAASVLGSRESVSHGGGGGHGAAGSSPTSSDSRGRPSSPARSTYSQAAFGQQELTARERLLHQHCTSSVFATEEEDGSEAGNRPLRQGLLPPATAAAAAHRVMPLQECEYGTKDENMQRRADQLQNPWYSDLFGRHTPKRSPTAARCAAAAVLANGSEPAAAAAAGEGEEVRAAGATGSAILGIDGATLDKLCARRRKAQLLRAPNAYERFISAMQSDIWSNFGDDGDSTTQKRLMRAHLAKETLLQEKYREQRRRQRLKDAVKDGHSKYFHMATSEEARVGEMGQNVDFLELQMKRAQPPKRSTAELHLSGVHPDMTEEDIEKLCRAEGGENAEKDACGGSTGGTTTQLKIRGKGGRGGLPKCSLQVKLATDILTSQCKGTGKVILQYLENEVDVEEVVRRLREANMGVRQVS